jgi:arsenate reductase-like glutaredoxin family protein
MTPEPMATGGGVGSLFRERRPMFTGGLLTPWIKKTLVEVLKELGKDVSQFTPKQIDAAKMIGLGDPRIMRKNDLVTAILAKLDLSKSEVVMSDLKKRKEDIVEHFIEQQFSMREPLSTRPHYQSPDPALGEIEESKALLESYREKLAGRKPNAQGGGVGSMFRRV